MFRNVKQRIRKLSRPSKDEDKPDKGQKCQDGAEGSHNNNKVGVTIGNTKLNLLSNAFKEAKNWLRAFKKALNTNRHSYNVCCYTVSNTLYIFGKKGCTRTGNFTTGYVTIVYKI